MAWRFKASKYKNAAPIVPKPETYVRDICVGSYQTYGNNITASAKFMAFNWDHAGSSLAVLPIDDSGRKSKLMPLLHAHTDTVTDMDFSPFHDGMLATGSQDCLVKIWHIPEAGLTESLSNPECTFSHKQRRVETVGFHPTANFLLHSTSYTTLTLWDLISQQELFSNADHTEVIQSVSWKKDGTLLATSCKDKQVRILDPRVEKACVKATNSHQSIKDSRVVWLGDNDRVLTTGFDAQRLRQVIIRDLRNFSEPEKTLELDCSTGILIPLYDADTGMMFLAGKGDTTIGYMEVTDRDPYLIEGIRHSGEQTKGACLVPKRALNVMQGEVNRLLQLTSSSVIPIMYQVPRKTYRDFHADLYPDTAGCHSDLNASEWFQGKNIPLAKISLDPSKRPNGEEPITVHKGPLSQLKEEIDSISVNIKSMNKPKAPSNVEKPEYHPVRSIIKGIEKDSFTKEKESFTKDKESFAKERECFVKETFVKEKEPIVKEKEPIVKEKQPIVKEKEPLVKEKEPIFTEKEPIIKEKEPVVKETEPDVKEKEPIAKESFAKESFAKESFAKESFTKESFAKESFAKEKEPCVKETFPKESLMQTESSVKESEYFTKEPESPAEENESLSKEEELISKEKELITKEMELIMKEKELQSKEQELIYKDTYSREGSFVKEYSEYDKVSELNKTNDIKNEEKQNDVQIVPPKPLPRTSRAGSVCEPVEDPSNVPKPVARPRTNSCAPVVTSVNPNIPIAGGYKPRLGPKPFTPPKLNETEPFDKVFSVPAVPGNHTNGLYDSHIPPNSEVPSSEKAKTPGAEKPFAEKPFAEKPLAEKPFGEKPFVEKPFAEKPFAEKPFAEKTLAEKAMAAEKVFAEKAAERELADKAADKALAEKAAERVLEKVSEKALEKASEKVPEKSAEKEKDKSPTSDTECTIIKGDGDSIGKSDTSAEEEVSSDSGYKPKTPSTAERRKLFETKSNSKENDQEDNFDTTDQSGNFDRTSSQRSSIAERRKMYERSQSVQESTTTIIEKPDGSPVMLRRKDSFKNNKNVDAAKKDNNRKSMPMSKQQSLDPQAGKKVEIAAPTPKRTSTVFGRVSKFRHLKGTPAHKSFHIENIRNLSRQISGECDGFHANPERVAVPLSGPGGKIAIFELSKTGRLPDGVIPALVHGNNVMDFAWDPFDHRRLAVACDDGVIKLWRIQEPGLTEQTNECEKEFNAHTDKIYFVKFHPTAKDVLASGSYDMTVRIWDLNTLTEKISLKGHTDQMFSFAWSPCGTFCSTVSKDSKIRVYKPRANDNPIREGKGPVGSRGARVVWAFDGNFIVVMGFDKVSERQIMVFKANDLNAPLNTVGLDVSPAILIPFYDEDSSTLFLTGKGDSTIYAFEVTEESPYICPLSHHRCSSLHQGLSFLSKNVCDVSNVEFAKALRLTNNTIEPLSFTVPRIKTELFQDDLFPPTRVTWTPSLTSEEWFAGKDKAPQRISLKPEGMDTLSESQGQANPGGCTINKSASQPFIGASQPFNRLGWNADMSGQTKVKQDEIQKSVSNRLEVNLKLEQDDMEGVDEKEWDE